ncbi:MAG: ABC transporter permease, partial [Planctomycetota bacterium]
MTGTKSSASLRSPLTRSREEMHAWERVLDRISDHVNPILVKESRQALKSRQFVITFSLLLICCWGWSLLGVALRSPQIAYIPGGRFMLAGYTVIQLFPLVVIIPFAAYRSL